MKTSGGHTFREVVAALELPRATRVLDLGAGGFVGETTTRHLVELFDGGLIAVEHNPERARALAERFGERITVVTADAFTYTPPKHADLVIADLDSTVLDGVFERLLPRADELLAPEGVLISALVTDLVVAYSGPNPLPPDGAENTAAFLKRLVGRLRVDPEALERAVAPHGFRLVGLHDKYRNDPLCFMAWAVLRRRAKTVRSNAAREGSVRGEPGLASRVKQRVTQDFAGEVRALASAGDAVTLDLVSDRSTCDERCAEHVDKWGTWAREAFRGTLTVNDVFPEDLRKQLGASEDDEDTELIVPGIALALLRTDRTTDDYVSAIGAKSRNMVRKAQRLGYESGLFDYNEHLEDVHAINTSKPVRSGGPMAQSYLERPRPLAGDDDSCPRHRSAWIGVRREGRLMAYCRLALVNELAVVDRILGHAEALPHGVMNLLTLECFHQGSASGTVRAINYLTLYSSTESLDRFKRNVGFESHAALLRVLRERGS